YQIVPPFGVRPGHEGEEMQRGDSATCTRRSGLCSRGSARRSSPSVATVDLVAEKSFQVRRRSW
uniref:Uncharacterized protein n=1 Tax=Terrapene triunguis TaxID=2587831 RepID=A0A674IVI6_9SAUR